MKRASLASSSMISIRSAIVPTSHALWGAAGAALATLIARAVCAAVVQWKLRRRDRDIYLERMLHYRPNAAVIRSMLRIGVPALKIISLSFPLAGFCIGVGTVFQALGYSIYSMIISMIRQLVVLIPSAFIIGKVTGDVTMVWYAFVIAELFSLTLSTIFFRRIRKNVIKPLFENK